MASNDCLAAALVTILFLSLHVSAAGPHTNPRPNVLILFVDDWGWGDVGANCLNMDTVPGASMMHLDKETACDSTTNKSFTPHMDSLAADGVRFTDFHVAASVCTPSRSAIQTGRMGARTGVTGNFGPGSLGGLPLKELTIAELLKPHGYATAAIGKWHLGPQGLFQPTKRGYDHYLGIPESHDYGCSDTSMGAPDAACLKWQYDRCPKNYQDTVPGSDPNPNCHPGPVNPWNYSIPLMLNEDIAEQPADLDGSRTGTHLSSKYSAFAADFIKNSTAAKKPFLLYMAFSHMHVPIVYSGKFKGKSGKGLLTDALMELDESVGVILGALKDNGVADDTIVFLTGDNGPPEDQCQWGGSKGPFMGAFQKSNKIPLMPASAGKMTTWEAGHREVGVVKYSASPIIPGSVSHALASSLDIVPTVASLLDIALPDDRHYDGVDLSPVLFHQHPIAHKSMFHSVGGQVWPESPGMFQAVRVLGDNNEWLSAVFQVNQMPQCCKGPNGYPNTPYNATCNHHIPTWLSIESDCHTKGNCVLLFNLTIDVAQSTPIDPTSQKYNRGMMLVMDAVRAYNASLVSDMINHPDYHSKGPKICCNPNNPVCRCDLL